MGTIGKNGTKHVCIVVCAKKVQDSNLNYIFFQSHFVLKGFRIQTQYYYMLLTTTIPDTSRSCAKSTSLGHSPSCCRYFGSCGSTMCVEPKPRLLATF
jgi:hypothetical protein